MLIRNKDEMSRLYHAGAFGNRIATFDSLAALYESDYREPVTLRYRGETGGRFCEYNVDRAAVPFVVGKWLAKGAERSKIYANGYVPSELITFQAEIQHGYRGYDIRYSTAARPMRDALAYDEKHAHGLTALAFLRHYLCPNSFDDLETLFESYPDAVVETTSVHGNIGVIPRRNTIFWEVRNY